MEEVVQVDALIRSAALSSARLRLGTPPAQASVPARAENVLREQIERQVRSELTQQLAEIEKQERARAHADGYSDGLVDGRAAAAAELTKSRDQLKEQLNGAIAALERARDESWSQLQARAGELAFSAVCRLIGYKAISQGFVLGLVEQTCAALRSDSTAVVRMHPRDIELLRELMCDDELQLRSMQLQLVADESLQLGGCVVNAASGEYDGGLENQLRRLHAILMSQDARKG